MKATSIVGKPENRLPNDAYYTDYRVASACVERIAGLIPPPKWILEPSCGGGSFVSACMKRWDDSQIVGVEIEPSSHGLLLADIPERMDFLAYRTRTKFDLIIGNPPYDDNLHAKHIDHAFTMLSETGVISMLLPVSFLGGHGRARGWFHEKHGPPRRIDVITPRPSFGKGGTSSMEYAVMSWGEIEPGNGFIRWSRQE